MGWQLASHNQCLNACPMRLRVVPTDVHVFMNMCSSMPRWWHGGAGMGWSRQRMA